jgi:hypothetical protein
MPQYVSSPQVVNQRFRFVHSPGGSAQAFAAADFLVALGSMYVTPNVVQSFVSAFRIREVELWAMSSPATAIATSATLTWIGPAPTVRDMTVTDTQLGTARSLHIRSRPPSNSLVKDWISFTTGNPIMFQLEYDTTACVYLDIVVDFTLNTFAQVGPNRTLLSAGSLGVVIWPSLDGTNQFEQVGLPTAV